HLFLNDRQHIFLAHEENVAAGLVLLEFVAGPSRENDCVAFLDLERTTRAVLDHLAWPDRQDFAFLRLALRVIRKNDSASGFFIRLKPPYDDSISQWLHLHGGLLLWNFNVSENSMTFDSGRH